MNSYKELKNHLLCEFYIIHKNPKTILYESRSVAKGLDAVIDNICNAVERQAMMTCITPPNKRTKTYNNDNSPDILNGVSTFFNDFVFQITTEKGKKYYKGGSSPQSLFNDNKGKLQCVPEIHISVGGATVDEMLEELSIGMGHELTHIYNFYQYAIKRRNPDGSFDASELYDNIYYDQKYKNISNTLHSTTKSGNEKTIGEILYHLNRMERNSYIAQLRRELLNNEDSITDARSAYEMVKQSQSWKHFKFLERNMQALYTITNSDVQNEIIVETNKIMGKSFTNYNQVVKYYLRRFSKWKKQYLRNVSRIAYDVYLEKNRSINVDECRLDGGDLDDLILKN